METNFEEKYYLDINRAIKSLEENIEEKVSYLKIENFPQHKQAFCFGIKEVLLKVNTCFIKNFDVYRIVKKQELLNVK